MLTLWHLGHPFLFTGPVCSSFSAEVCAILQALLWSRQHQQFCHFSSLTLALSSPPSFLLPQTLWQEPSSLFYCTIRIQCVPEHSSLPEKDAADDLARRVALLVPSLVLCSLSPLISYIHFCLFSDWRRTVSSKFFDTQVSSVSTEELVLSCHACCSLSRLRCNGNSLLLGSYLTRIGRFKNFSCSACGNPS